MRAEDREPGRGTVVGKALGTPFEGKPFEGTPFEGTPFEGKPFEGTAWGTDTLVEGMSDNGNDSVNCLKRWMNRETW